MSHNPISKETIKEQFATLGITRGDKIVMHSRLSSLGKVRDLVRLPNCGADAVLDALLELIGPEGILCVPTFTKTFLSPLTGPSGEIFDPDRTPSRVGSITNVLLSRPGRVRSLHPTHSWAAIGKDATALMEGHERTSTFGRDSVCGRMYDWDFKILWLGTTGTTNTSTHFAEDWLDLPNMTTEDALVKDGNSWKRVVVTRSPSGPRDFYRNGCKLDRLLDSWGIKKIGRVHEATVTIMRHREFMNHLLQAMIDDPCLLLRDDVQDAYHEQFFRLNREHMEALKRSKGGPDGIMAWLGCTKS